MALHVNHDDDPLQQTVSTNNKPDGDGDITATGGVSTEPNRDKLHDDGGNDEKEDTESHVIINLANGHTTRDPTEERNEQALPFLAQDRQRAITSTGFDPHPSKPEETAKAERNAHTAAATYQRRGTELQANHHLLPDIRDAWAGTGTETGGSGPAAVSVIRDAGKLLLSLETDQHGTTRVMHTLHHHHHHHHHHHGAEGQGGTKKEGRGGVRVAMVEDERYRRLERVLVKVQPPNDGYLELSPSFHLPRQGVTFTRPSSFLPPSSSSALLPRRQSVSSSSFRSPSSLSSSSVCCVAGPVAV